jgi:hypothetical protein
VTLVGDTSGSVAAKNRKTLAAFRQEVRALLAR